MYGGSLRPSQMFVVQELMMGTLSTMIHGSRPISEPSVNGSIAGQDDGIHDVGSLLPLANIIKVQQSVWICCSAWSKQPA